MFFIAVNNSCSQTFRFILQLNMNLRLAKKKGCNNNLVKKSLNFRSAPFLASRGHIFFSFQNITGIQDDFLFSSFASSFQNKHTVKEHVDSLRLTQIRRERREHRTHSLCLCLVRTPPSGT